MENGERINKDLHEEWKREEGECRIVNRERREEMESGKSWKRKNGQYNIKKRNGE